MPDPGRRYHVGRALDLEPSAPCLEFRALARDLGLEGAEEPVSRDQPYTADEEFVTGTAAEVTRLRAWLDYVRAEQPGART